MLQIIGYGDRLSVRPGETIEFKVSCEAGAQSYQAEILRLICGDDRPEGPGFKARAVKEAITGRFPGRRQPIEVGSYIRVAGAAVLDNMASFAITANIWPTTPAKGEQLLIGRRDGDGGFALVIGTSGDLALRVGESLVATGKALRKRQWYRIEARYDSASGTVTLSQTPLALIARDDSAASAAGKARMTAPPPATPLIIGRGYNGKIEAPRLSDPARGLIAAWDFAEGIGTTQITDRSPNALHGETVNLPARGMVGAGWNGQAFHWRERPDLYGAIHFHDDDLYDCRWQTDFAWKIPADLPSGFYAAHVTCAPGEETGEDYIPFFVCPPKGKTSAPVTFIASTATFMAYANSHHGYEDPIAELTYGSLLKFTPSDLFLRQRRDLGVSTYDVHRDGSGSCYSSRLRPLLTSRAKGRIWNYGADFHIVDWLAGSGQDCDIITDEDIHREGMDLLKPYRCVIAGSHPEYHSAAMLDAFDAYLAGGGRLMYLGGNGFYWRTAFHPELPGVIEVRRTEGTRTWQAHPAELHLSFTGEPGGLWRSSGRPPQKLVGVGFGSEGFDANSYFLRTADSFDPRARFIFEGVGKDERIGDFGSLGGAAGFELDIADAALGTPPHALTLARSVEHSNVYALTPEELISAQPATDGIENPKVRADMVFFETPRGGAVFSTGSITWATALAHNGYDNNVARITGNVLKRFIDPKPIE
jgi:N,N-dimethylformamidase